ncbi:phage portal protein [Sphingopyxis macrogoltabida]|uniref:phage portal protein n=1 Tax=Sphingopyxis macrogoltabida TaxID=33050 RepID=UPI001F21A05E|nr:phage portal protein [Sphingopyxis macrogoltabida]
MGLTDPRLYEVLSGRSAAGETVTKESALGLSATWACVNLVAGTIGSLPINVYRPGADGLSIVAKDHALYSLLHDSPNADQTALDFWEFIAGSIELDGNGIAEKVFLGDKLVALKALRADYVGRQRLASGAIEYRWTDEDGTPRVETEKKVLHIRGFGGGPLGGLATLSVCRNAFGSAQATDRAASAVFGNGATPSGILSTDKPLKADQRKEAEDLLTQKFAGALNAGRPMLLDNGLSWTQLSINPEDAQMLESRKFSGEEICRLFGVPPAMVGYGDKASNWGTGKEVDVLGFQKFNLRRRLKRIEQSLEKQLLTAADRAAGITIRFNIEALLRGASAERSSFYQSGLTNGWLTINEVRALENMPPVEGGDVPRMQSQNVPITEAPQIGHNGGPRLEETE